MSDSLALPVSVRARFDGMALALLDAFQPRAPRADPSPQGVARAWSIEEPVPKGEITDKDILSVAPVTRQDLAGRLLGVRAHAAGQAWVLDAAGSRRVDELARWLAARVEVSDVVAVEYVRDHLLRWLEARLGGDASVPWVEAILAEIAAEVEDWQILVPIDGLVLAEPFALGRVRFEWIDQATAGQMQTRVAGRMGPHLDTRTRAWVDGLAERHAGQIVANVRVRGVRSFARQEAARATDEALDLLRFLMSESADPLVRLRFARAGQLAPGHTSTMSVHDGVPWPADSATDSGGPIALDPKALRDNPLVTVLSGLCTTRDLPQFKQVCLSAVRLYARGGLLPAPEDRVVHAMVALETLLLKNSSERIKSTLQRRCAAALSRFGFDAAEVIASIGLAYKLRSNFLHHGKVLSPTELGEVGAALRISRAMISVSCTTRDVSVRTRSSYLPYLDRMASDAAPLPRAPSRAPTEASEE